MKGYVSAGLLVLFATVLVLVPGCANIQQQDSSGTTQRDQTEQLTQDSSEREESRVVSAEPLKTIHDFPADQDGDHVEAVIMTAKGDIVLHFYREVAPVTVSSFLNRARQGYYDGQCFHRVVPGFVIQAGDPLSTNPTDPYLGTGGPGYRIPAEFNQLPHLDGTLSMARSEDKNSGGSQFFICLGPQPSLNSQYTVFGQTVQGLEVVHSIVQGDVIDRVVIRPRTG